MSGYVDDEILVRHAQQGDRGAFNDLVHKHQDRAYRYAFKLTRDPDVAADVVAEGFLRVYNALHNFKAQSTFTTWLYRILTNCFLDLKKKDKSKFHNSLDETIQTDESEVAKELTDPTTPLDHAERTDREERLSDAIMKLAEYQRAMVVMYHSEGMSYEAIASALDMPVGTVKSRLNRARLTLREILMKDKELFHN